MKGRRYFWRFWAGRMWDLNMSLYSAPRQIRLPVPFTLSSCKGQNGHNKARFPGRLGKSIVGEKGVEKVAGGEDKQDNALNAMFLFSSANPAGPDARSTLPPTHIH